MWDLIPLAFCSNRCSALPLYNSSIFWDAQHTFLRVPWRWTQQILPKHFYPYKIIIIIIIIEFLTSQLCLGNIHLSWDVVINRIRLGGLICSLTCFLQLNTCQELQIFGIFLYVFGCRLSLVRLCGNGFGITPVDDITVGITCAAFCFHIAHI